MTYADRLETLSLNHCFMKDLKIYHQYQLSLPSKSLKTQFSENPKIRERQEKKRQEAKAIENQMRQVGIKLPPSPSRLEALIASLRSPDDKTGINLRMATQDIPVRAKTIFRPLLLKDLRVIINSGVWPAIKRRLGLVVEVLLRSQMEFRRSLL